jgi:hypothetical protein
MDVKAFFGDSVSDDNCVLIRLLCEGQLTIDKYNIPDLFPGTQRWVNQCHNYPSQQELVMSALNDLLEGFGIEAIRDPDDSDNIIATYVNMGDTYNGTIVYDMKEEQYVLTTWGDWYEGWINKQNEDNDTIQCGWCSHLTPFVNRDEDKDDPDDDDEWSMVICEQCGNYVDGKVGPGKNAQGR